MRECPHCKAQIGEDARFCLYCMTPLIEKEVILPQKKNHLWWIFVAVGAVLLGMVAALMILRDRNPVPPQSSSGSSAVVTTASTTESATGTTDAATDTTTDTTDSATDASTDSTAEITTDSTGESTEESTEETTTETTTESTAESTTEATTEPATAPTTEPTTPTPPPTTEPATESDPAPTIDPVDISTLPRYEWKDPDTLNTYRYRPAVQSDVLGLDYQVTDNDIVVETIHWFAFLDWTAIPSYVDGKRVVALSAPSYSDCSAYRVYLPETLLAVHDGALSGVIDELFIAGEVLALESDSTVGKYTDIHTSKTCRNQYGVLYANLPRWEEFPEQIYSYRTAGRGDGYDDNYTNINGDIYITDINRLSSNGVYHIPAYIDGKKVIGILIGSIKIRNVKTVYLPETVQQICKDTNTGQTQHLDVYFPGDAINVRNTCYYNMPNEVTLHCSATCIDGEGRYIKDCAADYGVDWQEWNG